MKIFKYITLVLILVSGNVFAQTEIEDFCISAESKKKCKEALKPFGYDASKTTRITFVEKRQLKEIEVPLYVGEKYRLVFNTEGVDQEVGIQIYDKKHDNSKRELLFDSNEFPGQSEFVFEPIKSRKMYINYDIPETNSNVKKGCVVFVLGYQLK